MQNLVFEKYGNFKGCDVSWISPYGEEEVLVVKGSHFPIFKTLDKYRESNDGKRQWFVCDHGSIVDSSFQNMFVLDPAWEGV